MKKDSSFCTLFSEQEVKKFISREIDYSFYSIYYPECREDIDLFTDLSGLSIEARAEAGFMENIKSRVKMVHSYCSDPDEKIPYLSLSDKDDQISKRSMALHKKAVDLAVKYEAKGITIHPDVYYFKGKMVTSTERIFTALEELTDYAATKKKDIFYENNFLLWRSDLPTNKTEEIESLSHATRGFKIDFNDTKFKSFGIDPNEWGETAVKMRAKGYENLKLCLCLSHAVTSCMIFNTDERLQRLNSFLDYSDYIGDIHWADNYLFDNRGIFDNHLPIGNGSIPEEFYRKLARLNVSGCLELWSRDNGPKGFSKSIDFIEGLRKKEKILKKFN